MSDFKGFTDKASGALHGAFAAAMSCGHTYVGSEHILCGLASGNSGAAALILGNNGISEGELLRKLELTVGKGVPTRLSAADLTPRAKRVMEDAIVFSGARGNLLAGTEDLLRAICECVECCGNIFLKELGGDVAEIVKECKGGASGAQLKQMKNQTLLKYGRDLTQWAAEGKIDPLIGRDREMERVIQILLRRRKNNPCLIGESGVGKTAVAEGLAARIAAGRVPAELLNKRIFMLDITSMIAGAKYRGDFEERIKTAVDEVVKDANIIVFIDEIHSIVGAGAAEGAIDAANILKPLLARGEFRLIGATTIAEYRRFIEKDSALERRFQPVDLAEPDEETAKSIIMGLRSAYEKHHGVEIGEDAVEAAVKLSVRYINDRFLPDKALDLIDEAAAGKRIGAEAACASPQEELKRLEEEKIEAAVSENYELAAKLRDRERVLRSSGGKQKPRRVSPEDIERIVSAYSGIPAEKIGEAECEKLSGLEAALKKEVIGQDEAAEKVAAAVVRGRTGFCGKNRPVSSFLFLGPTGVGKTHLCRVLARQVFGSEKSLIKLDMSEYGEKHTVSRLVGAPPGYVGFGEGTPFVETIRRRPYSVVLFDEIEKAGDEVLNVLLQILEDGALTAADGRKISFLNTIIIMTGNIGAKAITDRGTELGFTPGGSGAAALRSKVESELKARFSPEFLNRIDETVVFNKLDEKALASICALMLEETAKNAADNGIALSFTENAAAELVTMSRCDKYGARPLRRTISEKIGDFLAAAFLRGEIKRGSRAVIGVSGGKAVFAELSGGYCINEKEVVK